MSTWREFFRFSDLPDKRGSKKPGPVMLSFLNRYLEPLDSVKYKIEHDHKTVTGITTRMRHTVEIKPLSLQPIRIHIWSRVRQDYKLIDEIKPIRGRRLLINERLKTYKHDSVTQPHPQNSPDSSPPKKTRPSTDCPKPPLISKQQPQGVESVKTKNENAEPEHQTNRSVIDEIQVIQLKKIFPAAEDAYLAQVAAELNTDLVKYKLDTILRRAHFFAQVRQEAGSRLSPKQENLNYRPEVLVAKFSYYSEHRDEAEQDGRIERTEDVEITIKKCKKIFKRKIIVQRADQEKIANKAYGGRGRNGASSSGDGWRFRGRGIFQLTLRGNYNSFRNEYSQYWADDPIDFVQFPDKVCEFPYFIRSAVWYWVKHKAYLKADGGANDASVDAITAIVNGPARDAAAERRHNFHELTYPAFK